MRVLVTGHLGYIGTVLTPMLVDAGHDVVGLDSNLYSRCTFGLAGGPRVLERETGLSSALGFDDDGAPDGRVANARSEASPEELMDQAKNYVCRSCSTPVRFARPAC